LNPILTHTGITHRPSGGLRLRLPPVGLISFHFLPKSSSEARVGGPNALTNMRFFIGRITNSQYQVAHQANAERDLWGSPSPDDAPKYLKTPTLHMRGVGHPGANVLVLVKPGWGIHSSIVLLLLVSMRPDSFRVRSAFVLSI
jgi:hypothetical protein